MGSELDYVRTQISNLFESLDNMILKEHELATEYSASAVCEGLVLKVSVEIADE